MSAAAYSELLIGAGGRRLKTVQLKGREPWHQLTTLDINPHHQPDVVWDLMQMPLPFEDNRFDEIHAYEVLEHTGQQGDYPFFFRQFSEFWRILKPGGHLMGTSPALASRWLWGDPGHTRAITAESFMFLNQAEYQRLVGKSPMSDYRYLYQADFEPSLMRDDGATFSYCLKAIKPARISSG